MKTKSKLRIISLVMFFVALVFVFCALSAPTLGKTIYIGNYRFGAEQWIFCYKVYAAVMIVLFLVSFFVKDKK